MANSYPPVYNDSKDAVFRRLDPTKYTSLADFIDEINKPDNRDQLVKTYGYQQISGGLTGFLSLTGAVRASGTADEVQYWEETRLHAAAKVKNATAAAAATTMTFTKATGDASVLRLNDVVLYDGQYRGIVTAISPTGEVAHNATASYTVEFLSQSLAASAATANVDLPVIGNLFAQGSDQNSGYLESNVIKRTNAYSIIKEVFKVTGSQATNIGWVNVGNGDYRWYVKGEMDTRARFLDKREMMLLLGDSITNSLTTTNIGGTPTAGEGYFSAIEDRGIVQDGIITSLSTIDTLIENLDQQGAAPEYAMYVNTAQALEIDDMVASLNGAAGFANTTAGINAFGGRGNELGFDSFKRGGYTFHKHSWKLLNDPTLLGADSYYKGAMIPLTTVVDPKTGDRAAALELNYKDTNGYSREMEHWMTGSILGVNNTNEDSLQFNYRSECALVTRAANQHILITE